MNKTLLIVDDEPESLKGYGEFLTPGPSTPARKSSRSASTATAASIQDDYTPLLAKSGEEAVALFKAEIAKRRRVAAGFFDVKLGGSMDLLKPFTASEIQTRTEMVIARAKTRSEVEGLVAEAIDHQEHGRWQRAQGRYEDAINLDPTQDTALRGLGDILIKLKSVHDALPFYRRAVEAGPMNAKNYLRLASVYETIGWWEKAIALLQSGHQQISFNAELHFHLGRLYHRRDMIPQAKAEFEKTLEIQLDHQEARLTLEMISNRGSDE
jgi:tetratricopeptide (TPR) repeat protein